MGSTLSRNLRDLRSVSGFLFLAALAAGAYPPVATAASPERLSVTAVRFWSLGDVTRIAVQTTGEFRYKYRRLSNPDRVYFDVFDSRHTMSKTVIHVIPVGDGLVKQIRVAQNQADVTRIVVDLDTEVDIASSHLANPDRLMIEVRAKAPKPRKAATRSSPGLPKLPGPEVTSTAASQAPTAEAPAAPARVVEKIPSPPVKAAKETPPPPAETAASQTPPQPAAETPEPKAAEPAPAEVALVAKPAEGNRGGGRSLTRVLGLKLGRVVLDPGHGGRDTGTIGPAGLMEKNIVLDVATRLGALIEEGMGSEVVYTRTDDASVPLEARTNLANEKKADLFLSIHVNSSRYRSVNGVETFYLNFTESRADLELAARENAGSQKSIHELKELVQKIALEDKIQESRDFASSIQQAVHELAKKNDRGARNRGVKKAPFVVLIGAEMPSVLVELGFISNTRDEGLLKKPEHRQSIAEALYKGLSDYAKTLSHFQVAQTSAHE